MKNILFGLFFLSSMVQAGTVEDLAIKISELKGEDMSSFLSVVKMGVSSDKFDAIKSLAGCLQGVDLSQIKVTALSSSGDLEAPVKLYDEIKKSCGKEIVALEALSKK